MRRVTSAVAMAATPSPRPVRPSPSVVVADRLTGAPEGVREGRGGLVAARAEARDVADDLHRDVADLPAGVAHAAGRLGQEGDAGGAGPLGLRRAEVRAEVAEPGRGEEGVAGGVRGDVGVRVTLEPGRLVRPGQAGEVHRDARRRAGARRCRCRCAGCRNRAVRTSRRHHARRTRHNGRVTARRPPWALAGVLAGLAGLATSYATAMVLTIREAPVVAVAELVIRLTPGRGRGAGHLGAGPLGQAGAGRRDPGLPRGLLRARRAAGVEGLVAAAAGVVRPRRHRPGRGPRAARCRAGRHPAGAGRAASPGSPHTPPSPTRCTASGVGPTSSRASDGSSSWSPVRSRSPRWASPSAAASSAPGAGKSRRAAGCCASPASPGARRRPRPRVGLAGIAPWQTPNEDFYLIDTTLAKPTIDPEEWSLRIHGLVDRELVLTYSDLVARRDDGVVDHPQLRQQRGGRRTRRQRPLERRTTGRPAGRPRRRADADCVLQTSHDGWFCATPLAALTDDRDAMLAVAMNGRPLPHRARLPGAHGRARPLRLRLGHASGSSTWR